MKIEPLTKAGFAPFGDVIEIDGAQHFPINQGFAERFNDLAVVDAEAVNISIVIANPRPRPIAITLMERHPLGSQIFYPLQDRPWLVVVCGNPKDATSFRAFSGHGPAGHQLCPQYLASSASGAGGGEPLSGCGPQGAGQQIWKKLRLMK